MRTALTYKDDVFSVRLGLDNDGPVLILGNPGRSNSDEWFNCTVKRSEDSWSGDVLVLYRDEIFSNARVSDERELSPEELVTLIETNHHGSEALVKYFKDSGILNKMSSLDQHDLKTYRETYKDLEKVTGVIPYDENYADKLARQTVIDRHFEIAEKIVRKLDDKLSMSW